MSNIVGDIAIKVGADISPLVRDLGRASGEANGLGGRIGGLSRGMGSFKVASAAVAGTVLAVGAAMAALTKASMDNIDALSKQARAVGISVASFQAMAMVAGESGVETEKLGKILVKMQDNIANLGKGSAAKVDAFRALGLSMSDLSGLGADEQFRLLAERISAIRDPVQKTALAMDVFGKSGADAINMLSGYGAAVDNAAAFQQQFGIAVSDLDAQNIEAANDAMGRLSMASEGLGNVLASKLAPFITTVSNGLIGFIANAIGAERAMNDMFGSADRAKQILGEDVFTALMKSRGAIEEASGAISDLNFNWADLERQVGASVRVISGDIASLLDDTRTEKMALQLNEVVTEMQRLTLAYDGSTEGAEAYEAAMKAAMDQAVALLEKAKEINGIDTSVAVGSIDLLRASLSATLRIAAALRATLPGGAELPPEDGTVAAPYVSSGRGTVNMSPVDAMIAGINTGLVSTGIPDKPGKGGKGGGGKGDRLADELARLREYFAEESEVLALQYEERLAKIEEFRAAKLITEQEYNDLEAQAKEDHERKLAEIEAKFQRQRLGDVGDFFGSMAAIASAGGGKMVKAAAVFSAAQGLINSYTAYTEVLKDPSFVGRPFARFAAAGAVLASGLKMVSAIRGVGSSGGGGGAGAGAAAAQPATAPAAPLDVRLTGISAGDLFSGAQLSGLLDRLSAEAGDRGYKLMVAQ
jgi:hypothetical protein